ncbi:uncharacterized protein [Gorilla gorilla gorilla]|uniref:uncharacterized protein n=1 Tax=Gorilla gorilla gorilla TaxID=9595 RepID=UPI0024462AF0|nr:uncharacterized protein LOC115931843 [Gorilla gorilla gorilla]
MTRERVGAARDRLARLRGGAGGGASPRGHPRAPGLAAREATHPRPTLSLAQTLDRDGAVRRTADFPPRQKAALRACGTPARPPYVRQRLRGSRGLGPFGCLGLFVSPSGLSTLHLTPSGRNGEF